MATQPLEQADLLHAQSRNDEAVALVESAAAAGHADALFRLALWKLAGDRLPRDLPGARRALRAATERGSADAALIEVALTANGSGADADWPLAYARLVAAAMHDQVAAAQLHLLKQMFLTAEGAPTAPPITRQVGEQPAVWHILRFFSPAECLHVAQCAADLLTPATVVDPKTGRNVAHPIRSSDGAVIGPTRETLVVQALNRRIATATGTDVRQGEALAILRYNQGQQFRPHLDAIEGAGNQRIKTVLVYLNEGFGGGATSFAYNGIRITPATGDAVIFDNVCSDGSIDRTAQHAGEPITEGVKWLATRWIRARPFDVWTGPEAVS